MLSRELQTDNADLLDALIELGAQQKTQTPLILLRFWG